MISWTIIFQKQHRQTTMTTSNTQARKHELMQSTETYKNNMTKEVTMLNQKLKKAGLTALLAGAALVTTYYVATKLFGKSKKKIAIQPVGLNNEGNYQLVSQRPESSTSYWVALIKEQMFLFLLALLKNKLAAYVETLDKEDLTNGISTITSFFKSKTVETTNINS